MNILDTAIALESSYTQAFSSDAIFSSVLAKFDFGLGYKVMAILK